ncbi:hypothetical protein [Sporomusa sp.]|uniref:hypothetical protein n=1 Tax=Sporomusa sp. TaxID=2078658 RepID=UPI002C7ECA1E|nr:hypothetical protein [Sporomusa sp.]HWR42272.1 hypothetical protein [Sporomusa sp.]
MEGSQISKKKIDLSWDDMVSEFIEYCRELGHLVEREKTTDKIVKVSKKVVVRTKELDQIRKNFSLRLFSDSNNLFDAHNHYRFNSDQSESSLSQLIREIELQENTDIGNIFNYLDKKKKYLKQFLGLDYKQNWLPEQEFQIHQLLLILFRCALKGKKGILENISESSFWRFRNEEDNPYKDSVFFIQKELLKGINFIDALNIVHFVENFRFCLNYTTKVIVDSVLKELISPSQEDIISVRDDLLTMILVYLKELNTGKQVTFEGFDNLFLRAFYNFRLLGISDSLKEPRLEISLDYINDKSAGALDSLKKRLRLNELLLTKYSDMQKKSDSKSNTVWVKFVNRLEPVEDFIKENERYIAECLGSEVYPIAVQRHSADYVKLVRLFLLYNMADEPYVVTAHELFWIIFLYEECQFHEKPLGCVTSIIYRMKKIGKVGEFHRVALRYGYNGGKTNRKNKRFLEILRDLREEDISPDLMIRDKANELYEIICFLNTLNSLLAQESDKLVKTKLEIKKQLYIYLRRVTPLKDTESRKYLDITQIAESIMGTDKLRQYCKWKEMKMQKKLFKCLHPDYQDADLKIHKTCE